MISEHDRVGRAQSRVSREEGASRELRATTKLERVEHSRRLDNVSSQGYIGASGYLASWLSGLPAELTDDVAFDFPGTPGSGGGNYAW